ncbi:hypothetical protein BST61_g10107 [Cercospora zeina]
MGKPSLPVNSQEIFDFVIIGAGITGINAAYRIEQQFPNKTYAILDRRGETGGTWAFFKYPGGQYMWRGTMLQDVPNLMIVIGYRNNSWTLGSDLATRIFLKVVQEMERQRATSVVPTLSKEEAGKLETVPLWNMSSTYLQNPTYPKASLTAPWTVKDFHEPDR